MINRYEYDSNYSCKRSPSMERAAGILAAISIVGSLILYISLPCGAMAIILAFLSVGGSRSMSARAVRAAIMGAMGIALTIILYSYALYFMFATYGSWEGIMEAVSAQYGLIY